MEWRMLAVFGAVLCLWLFGPAYGINSTVAVMIGILLMIVFGLLDWEACLGEKKAWDTLLWLGGFVAMGGELKALGIFTWFGGEVGASLGAFRWEVAFPLLCAVYFYSHYLFASATAHVVGMYLVCLVTAVQVGTPPMVAAMALSLVSNLYGGLTHYGNASAPLYFGSGHCSLSHWWKVGFVASLANILVWGVVGMAWWKVIGLW
jgi:DASS family divalent anion:Na+ symporter